MNCLEELFLMCWEESDPKTPDFLESKALRDKIETKVEALIGDEMMDKFMEAQWDYMELECRKYFLTGLRFGLELLRL